MSQYYTPKRTRNIYDPHAITPYKLSRTKIDLFFECPKCFYIDRRLGVARPPGFPFNLNNAVDTLLKKEFDTYRSKGETHPLLEKYGIDARPVMHDDLDKWRHNFTGIQYLHEPTNLIIFGAIDDLWQNSSGEYIIVDYKSTSKNGKITKLNLGWHKAYKRQMEVYQWLLRKKGLKVSETGYFLYCNGKTNVNAFNGTLQFDMTLIPYNGDDDWVESTVREAYQCLLSNTIPKSGKDCDFCAYRDSVSSVTN